MNTKEAIEYLKYQGTIQINKIEFINEEDRCGNYDKKKKEEDIT